jgi:hypothetical protein
MKKSILVVSVVGVLLLIAGALFAGDITGQQWRVYNVKPDTSSFWDINHVGAPTGALEFPIQKFVSTTTGSFVVYFLNNYNVNLAGKTITATMFWTPAAPGAYKTRSATCSTGAYVRLEFQDVTAGPYDPNDYWWSVTSLDLNSLTTGTLSAALTDRSAWTNMIGRDANDTTTTTWNNWNTGQTDTMDTPYNGFTRALKNVKQIGLSFGNGCSYASGIALDGQSQPGKFTVTSFKVTP